MTAVPLERQAPLESSLVKGEGRELREWTLEFLHHFFEIDRPLQTCLHTLWPASAP